MSNQTKKAPTLKAETQKELDKIETVSGKIRYLNKAGLSRADIARVLGKRYQHVRNVLVEDERSKANKA